MYPAIDKLNEEHLLLFDGVCNLCNGAVKFVIKRDKKKKFKFASLQSPYAQSLLVKFDLPAKNFESFVYVKNNIFYLKSSAALLLLKDLGGIWKLFYTFIIIPKFMRDFVYDTIAKNRYQTFGKSDSCMIPSPDIKERFLS